LAMDLERDARAAGLCLSEPASTNMEHVNGCEAGLNSAVMSTAWAATSWEVPVPVHTGDRTGSSYGGSSGRSVSSNIIQLSTAHAVPVPATPQSELVFDAQLMPAAQNVPETQIPVFDTNGQFLGT
jgi:hypothetical protein